MVIIASVQLTWNFIKEVRKHIIQNFISRLYFFASTFFINLVLSRLLGASESGQLYYVVNNLSIVTLVASLSLESGMTYFSSKEEISKKQLATISIMWSIAAAAITSLILLFFFSNTQLRIPGGYAIYCFLFIGGTLFTTYFSGLFFAQRQFSYPHLIPAIINTFVTIYCARVLVYNRGGDTSAAIAIYFASFTVSGMLLALLYHQKYGVRFFGEFPTSVTLRKLFRYSSLALVANVVSFLAYRIDYWILKSFSPSIISQAALGNYIQVGKLVQLFLFAPTIVASIVFPISAANVDSKFEYTFKTTTWRVFALNLLGCITLVIAGKWLFTYLYGNSFSLMYACFLFSIPAILSISMTRILASYFAGTNRIIYNLSGSFIALVTITALNFLLIPKMGINGAALADSVGYMLYMIFLLTLFRLKG